ncbi:ABC-type multidrug transport system ATPase subunit [Lipingzhangella halophila]|uniref:ABC-type multidrug transport system ATPase subunit n=1 Tax=Lipingzhangella halophila TaxID=1783352 RepID=A0A7W7RLP9_9ACTN|nr:ABC transporter ATP-binding protein [Lipingzhangella halophila]MBB4933776.1 ABC-type multidrug transport system ATPase subunit [Lipingzhangella halophila]
MHITATDVRYRYGRAPALNGVTLDIGGGVFGLLGPNGAGKSTFLRLLAGVLRPRSGRLVVGGHNMSRGSARRGIRRLVGYVPERPTLYPHLTTREFLDYTALLSGMADTRQRRERTGHVLERLELTLEARTRIGALSTGTCQRVAIAQALIGEPRLLVLDEPTVGMDPLHRHRVRALLAELCRTTTVVLSTHVLDDVRRLCDRVAVLRAGTTAFAGSPRELAGTAPETCDLEAAYAAVVSGSAGPFHYREP